MGRIILLSQPLAPDKQRKSFFYFLCGLRMKTFQCWMNIQQLSHPGSYVRLIGGPSSVVFVQFVFLLVWVPFTCWPVLVLDHRTRQIILAGLSLKVWGWPSVALLKSFTLASFDAEVWASIRWRWPLDVGMDLCVGSADTITLALKI